MTGRETRSFEDVVDEELQLDNLERARRHPTYTNSYIAWGEYARILDPYFALFSPRQILVVFTSDLDTAPGRVVRSVYEFIGAAPDFVPHNLGKRYRVGAATRRTSRITPDGLQRALASNKMARSMWHSLPSGARSRVDQAFRGLCVPIRFVEPHAPCGSAIEAAVDNEIRMRAHFEQDREHLVRLGIMPPWAAPEKVGG